MFDHRKDKIQVLHGCCLWYSIHQARFYKSASKSALHCNSADSRIVDQNVECGWMWLFHVISMYVIFHNSTYSLKIEVCRVFRENESWLPDLEALLHRCHWVSGSVYRYHSWEIFLASCCVCTSLVLGVCTSLVLGGKVLSLGQWLGLALSKNYLSYIYWLS